MSAHTGEENHKHSLLKMMTRAQCYNKADTTWHILWGLSSCAFLFPSQRRAATEISLIPTKHLCHKINTSQNCLSTRKDSGSSVLIFLFYSVFVFFFVFVFFRGCSAQLINTGILFTPSFGLYWFWGPTHYCNFSSVPFHLFISFSSHQQRGFRLGMIYASP